MNKDICERYDSSVLQQLFKIVTDDKTKGLKEKDTFPVSVIQAIFDGISGVRLDHILSLINCIYVPFQGTAEKTRLSVRSQMRRKGLIIVYRDLDNITHTQRYIYKCSVSDDNWKDDAHWEDCFVGFKDLDFVETLKKYLIQYIDDKFSALLPPDGYEFVIVKKEETAPDGYEYVVYADDDGVLNKVYSSNKELIVRKINKK